MAQGTRILDAILIPNGYQQVTSLSSATALTVPNGTILAVIQAESQNVRYRDDGTNPTASVGFILAAGDNVVYNGNIAALKFIEVTASAKLNVLYYK